MHGFRAHAVDLPFIAARTGLCLTLTLIVRAALCRQIIVFKETLWPLIRELFHHLEQLRGSSQGDIAPASCSMTLEGYDPQGPRPDPRPLHAGAVAARYSQF
jgi:hypothetical protein